MPIASHSSRSSTCSVMVSGNWSAIAFAAPARYVGLHTFGGASTRYRAYSVPRASAVPLATDASKAEPPDNPSNSTDASGGGLDSDLKRCVSPARRLRRTQSPAVRVR